MTSASHTATGETLIFTCAGAAHCGQVANRAALDLTQRGMGQIFCLAAVAAEVPDKVQRSRAAGMRVAIDGCEDHCTRKTLEKAGLPVEVHAELTAIGIEKKPDVPSLIADARRVVEHVSWKIAAHLAVAETGGHSRPST
jgi:uncharacterized metal-binding protein